MKKFPSHITGLKNLDKETLNFILKKTSEFKKQIISGKNNFPDLSKLSVLNLFLEDSTRTRISFELAEKHLGMKVVNFNAGMSSLSKGESVIDTIRNLDSMYFDFIVSRSSSSGFPELIKKYSRAKTINGGDGINEHPTQGLLDIFTIKENFNKLENLKVCIIGDISHSRVAFSNIYGLKTLGVNISVCAPDSFLPSDIESLGVKKIGNIETAIKQSNVIILLRVQMERNAGYLLPSLSEFNKYYGLNLSRLSLNPDLIVLHPGPWNTGVELDEEILESPQIRFFEQVTNGLAVKMALFSLMAEKK
ncbi:MAG TPA: aspartate carbamoyltransferase catalytic subunit [Ignavibacteria bacterium]|nr:aspartate carbamoyltransferase catalytic subunit [Ignavibacteria bacterium]